jgi:hypothetical protein
MRRIIEKPKHVEDDFALHLKQGSTYHVEDD